MHRRSPLVTVVILGALVALSSCSSVDRPAATVDGHKITMEQFESVAKGGQAARSAAAAAEPEGTIANLSFAVGDDARNTLTGQIYTELYSKAAADVGHPITDTDRATVAAQLTDPSLTPAFKDLLVNFNAAKDVLLESATPDPEAAYNAGIAASGVACVSHILVDTPEAAADIVSQLADGGDFAKLAASDSTDTGSGSAGGSLGPCSTAADFQGQYVPEFVDGALAAKPGVPTEPIKSQFGYHIILLRPWAEAKDEATSLVQQHGLDEFTVGLFDTAAISIDPSIGKWSPGRRAVVPLDLAEPDAAAVTG